LAPKGISDNVLDAIFLFDWRNKTLWEMICIYSFPNILNNKQCKIKSESYLMIFQNLANLHATSSWSLKPNDCFKVLTSLHPLKIFKVHQPNGHLIFIRMIGQCTKHVLTYLYWVSQRYHNTFFKTKGFQFLETWVLRYWHGNCRSVKTKFLAVRAELKISPILYPTPEIFCIFMGKNRN
jgi:hypothetical protein